MRRAVIAAAVGFAVSAPGACSPPPPRSEAAGVVAQAPSPAADTVLGQIDAFKRDDFTAAYQFASSAIKAQFDRQAFERMVRGGYPEIAAPSEARVLDQGRVAAGREYVLLRVRGKSGTAVEALYELVQEDGDWKIDAVVTRPPRPPI
jgi:hypothetical protein